MVLKDRAKPIVFESNGVFLYVLLVFLLVFVYMFDSWGLFCANPSGALCLLSMYSLNSLFIFETTYYQYIIKTQFIPTNMFSILIKFGIFLFYVITLYSNVNAR